MLTYKTDESFFTFITPFLTGHLISPVRNWFREAPGAHNRFIYNNQLTITGAPLQKIEEFYPTVKVIQVIVNPWHAWLDTYRRETVNKLDLFNQDSSKRISFTEFMYTRLSKKKQMLNQIESAQYWKDGDLHQAHCMFKLDNLEHDFKIIQQYFETDLPIRVPPLPDYRPYYTDEMRRNISRLYAKDIEYFGFAF